MAGEKTYNTIDCKQTLLLVEIKEDVYGGYKPDLLADRTSQADSKSYICTKCNGILRKACLIEEQNLVCEVCVGSGRSMSMVKSRKEIEELMAKCPLAGRGCIWKGSMREIDSHLDKCSELIVNCSNVCGVILKRSELVNHCENECLNRVVNCMHCKGVMQYKEIEIHLTTCSVLPLLCPNECRKTFLRKEMNSHIEKDCPNTLVDCPNECGLKLKRTIISDHCEDECQHRMVRCKYCRTPMQLLALENHYKSCPEFPLVCPNECLKSLIRKEINSHLEKECPNALVSCPYKEMGCKVAMKRSELKEHKRKFESSHLDKTVIYYSNRINVMHTRMRKKETENETLAKKVESLENQMQEKEAEVESFVNEVKLLKMRITQMEFDVETPLSPSEPEHTPEHKFAIEISGASTNYVRTESKEQKQRKKTGFFKFNKPENLPEMKIGHLKLGFLQAHKYIDGASGKWEKCLVAMGDGEVQIYEKVKHYDKKVAATLLMDNCYGVLRYQEDWKPKKPAVPPDYSPENGFVIRIAGKSHYFVAESAEDASEWLELLEESKIKNCMLKPIS